MSQKRPSYQAFYLPGPGDLPSQQALTIGIRWLLRQPGRPLLVLSTKSVLTNNRLLADAVGKSEVSVVAGACPSVTDWSGGSILFWASERALLGIDEELSGVQAVCVIAWSRGDKDAWIVAHQAKDLRHPEVPVDTARLSPVVEIAMSYAARAINHNYGLALTVDKAYVVRTLQELVRAGYGYTVKGLVAWAMVNGWQPAEISLLQDMAQGVLDGRRFQLGDKCGPTNGAATGG